MIKTRSIDFALFEGVINADDVSAYMDGVMDEEQAMWLEHCISISTDPTWYPNKYQVAKDLISLCDIDNEIKVARQFYAEYAAELSERMPGKALYLGFAEQGLWIAPMRKKSESRRGYKSRFMSWFNLWVASNLERSRGNIVGLPDDEIVCEIGEPPMQQPERERRRTSRRERTA